MKQLTIFLATLSTLVWIQVNGVCADEKAKIVESARDQIGLKKM